VSRDDPILNTRVIALLTLKNLAELSKKSTEPTCFNMLLTLKEITDRALKHKGSKPNIQTFRDDVPQTPYDALSRRATEKPATTENASALRLIYSWRYQNSFFSLQTSLKTALYALADNLYLFPAV
jgi:hypothetical protein